MIMRPAAAPLELWGGVECTVNRVGDVYYDQLARTGHAARLDDLDRIAALGVRRLRYPVLWERTAPRRLEDADWNWPDERLARLQELSVDPIVGFVHHGSGPAHTSLLDPAFPELLAAYAAAVARRYPWVEHYTPVNEPLTTARFSALYGHWYPHARDDGSFVRALLNETRATVLAMRAIRAVNPTARLVQTEDYACTMSTPELRYQADFENERRWLGFDLLCGRVRPGHPLWRWLRTAGASTRELTWFEANAMPPDVIGLDYYVVSERYLDGDLDAYPRAHHGGNGRHAYADIEAVRVEGLSPTGHREVLLQAWRRYGLPVAITEAHLGGMDIADQMRWLSEAGRGAHEARAEGADVRAVTAWALFGLVDWHNLLTRCDDEYERGAFDAAYNPPRPTALAWLIGELAAGRAPEHPALAGLGWWRRPERILYGAGTRDDPA